MQNYSSTAVQTMLPLRLLEIGLDKAMKHINTLKLARCDIIFGIDLLFHF